MINEKNTIILGAGLTGLSCAYHLKDNYVLYEKESSPGGLCRSLHTSGFTFDLTGHLLHMHDDYAKKLVKELLKNNALQVNRNAWIFSKNVYTRYPFQAHTFGLPKKVVKECLSDFFAAQAKLKRYHTEPSSFQDWIIRYFGKGIGRHFMIPYNEKIWLRSLQELTTEWVSRFIPQPSVEDVLKGSLTDSPSALGYNTSFLYPKKGGIQSLVDALAARTAKPICSAEAVRVRWYDRRVEITGKGPIMYDNLVSTIPLPVLINRMHRVPPDVVHAAQSLRWTSVLCINLAFQRPAFTDRHWIYFPEKDFVFYRVGFHSNLSPHNAPKGFSSIYVELSYQPGKRPNMKKILNKVIAGLNRADILRPADKIVKIQVIPVPYAYVVYDHNRTPAVSRIQQFLRSHNIISTGRYGGWKYSYMEEALLDGKEAASACVHG